MARHYNPSIVERLQRTFGFKAGDVLSDDISGVVAVLPIHPVQRIVKIANRSSTGTTTLYTTPADKDFYLTSVFLNVTKDATCDVSNTDGPIIRAVIDGVTTTIIQVSVLTLTAQNYGQVISLPHPIKLDRNSAVTLAGATFSAGALSKAGGIFGYTEEVTQT